MIMIHEHKLSDFQANKPTIENTEIQQPSQNIQNTNTVLSTLRHCLLETFES